MTRIELLKRILVKEYNGKIKFDSGLLPSNSFTLNFLLHLYAVYHDVAAELIDITGATQNMYQPSQTGTYRDRIDGVADDDDMGIVVGTGTTAENNSDYALDTQIAHGTGAGQLQYGSVSIAAPSVTGSNADVVVTRTFVNGSGASITVKEIGVYCRTYTILPAYKYFCIVRDVLVSPVEVGNGQTLTVQYTFRVTV